MAAARAGARVQFVGAFGNDPAADRLRAHLLANGVGLDGAVELPGPSGTAIIMVDAGAENMIVVAPGVNAQLTVSPAVLTDCDVLLTQLEIPPTTALAAARAARAAGAVVMVNASPAGQDAGALAELATVADVVIVNSSEADEWPWQSTHFVVTLGARGARYIGPDGEFDVAGPGRYSPGHHRCRRRVRGCAGRELATGSRFSRRTIARLAAGLCGWGIGDADAGRW